MINHFKSFVVYLFKLYAKRRYDIFFDKLSNPKMTQLKLRHDLEMKYRKSHRYQFTQIPFDELTIHDYNQLIAVGKIEEVVTDSIICFEETSGSSGIKKKIPYTKTLLNSFRSMFILWAYDILKGVDFKSYKFYFSISPQFSNSDSGLEDDSEYLGALSPILKPFIVDLKGAKRIKNSDEFLMKLALRLVSERGLEIISIWSPTFLLTLIDYIESHQDEFLSHLKKGSYKDLEFKAYELSSTIPKDLFPSLKFVSSWGSASATVNYQKLQKRLPSGVTMQKKGLLATEAPMTVPILGHPGGVPLIDEVFFEFINAKGEIKYLWELSKEEEYELIISQKGGLYRYPMKDLVYVVGNIGKTPMLEFRGRSSQTSDLVGEKLHESEVFSAIKNRATALIASESNLCYFILADENFNKDDLAEIESSLRSNPHYHNARELKQLKPLQLIQVVNPQMLLKDYHQKILGVNSGDIKDSALIYRKGDEFLNLLC